jgi:hypothetical protein
MKVMYDIIGFNPWNAFSVTTNESHSYAAIAQPTIFGVTDIYFLAGYFGLMDVVVDDIKRLTEHTVCTKKGTKIEADVFIKATGTAPSRKIDKEFGIKEVVGQWVNGDPKRPVALGVKGVQAQNFGSFSVGPGFAPMMKQFAWFIDYPQDWAIIEGLLPKHPADEKFPAYIVPASYATAMGMSFGNAIPILSWQCGEQGAIKSRKQRQAHPLPEYLGQCRYEWESYCKFFRHHNMVDDRPDPPYPYTEEIMHDFLRKVGEDAVRWGA